jgi:hypothetical protein
MGFYSSLRTKWMSLESRTLGGRRGKPPLSGWETLRAGRLVSYVGAARRVLNGRSREGQTTIWVTDTAQTTGRPC